MAKDTKTLEFSLKLDSIPVVLKDATGIEGNYTLQEMNGEGVDVWHDFVRGKLNMTPESDDKGSIKLTVAKDGKCEMFGMEAKLISLCLYDSKNELVKEVMIQKFPAKVREGLFDAAQKLNGLDTKSKKAAKNDL